MSDPGFEVFDRDSRSPQLRKSTMPRSRLYALGFPERREAAALELGRIAMNRTCVLLAANFLFCVAAVQAAQPPEAYLHLKPLEWHIGDWVTQYEATADAGPIKKGDTVKVNFSLRWSPDRTFMENHSSSEVNGKRITSSLEVISWDTERSVVAHSYFGTWGRGQGVWTKTGDKAELEWTIQGPYGTFKGTSWASKEQDSWKWQIIKQTRNGEPMAEMPVAVFQRKKGVAAGDLWDAYRKLAAGNWTGEGKSLWDAPEGQVLKGAAFKFKLSLASEMDGKVLTGPQDFLREGKDKPSLSRVVAAWDPDAAQIRLRAYWAEGFLEELFLSRRSGNTFHGVYTGKAPNDSVIQWPIDLRFFNADSYEYKFTAGPYQGKVLSTWKRAEK
jgi:hypothetical protein